jgi:uncharacterized protein (DUF1697 family)
MKDLARLFSTAGCGDVKTYIQSGNVVFTAGRDIAKGVAERIAKDIEGSFGFKCPIILRSAAEMAAVVKANPFLAAGKNESTLHVFFLSGEPTPAKVKNLDPARGTPDEFVVRGREIYGYFPNGLGRSKLTNTYFDSKLGVPSTARNWRTVLKLAELAELARA